MKIHWPVAIAMLLLLGAVGWYMWTIAHQPPAAPAPPAPPSSTLNAPSPFLPPAAPPAAGNTATPAHPAAHGASHSAPARHH